MTHKRNTTGLAEAAKKRRLEALSRAKTAIKKLHRTNKPVNFNTVAKEANVGKPFLYKELELREYIENLRSQELASKKTKPRKISSASDKSKDNIIQMLKQRLRESEDEKKQLKKQIEVLYGRLCNN